MNNLQKAMIRGLYKEAGVKETLNNLFEKAKKYYADNEGTIKRAGITGGSALAGAGVSAGIDKLRGKKVSVLRMLMSGMGAGAVAEGAQYATKHKDEILNYISNLLHRDGNTTISGPEFIKKVENYKKSPMQKVVEEATESLPKSEEATEVPQIRKTV